MLAPFVFFILTTGALAAPLPPKEGYAYKGQPSLVNGYWSALTSEQSFVTAFSVDGWIGHRILAGENSILSFLNRADSFQCVDDYSFRTVSSGSLFLTGPLDNAAKSTHTCSLIQIVNDTLRFAELPLEGGSCPDFELLPTGKGPAASLGSDESLTATRSGILLRVPSVIPSSTTVCVNRTITTSTFEGKPPASTPSLANGPSCGNYTSAWAAPITQGVWQEQTSSPSGNLMLNSLLVGGYLQWSKSPDQMVLTTVRPRSHSCKGPVGAAMASYLERRTLASSETISEWKCDVNRLESRIEVIGESLLFVRETKKKVGSVFSLYQPLPNKPKLVCGLPECHWVGDYGLKPLFRPCNQFYFAFSYTNCSYNTLGLKPIKQASALGKEITWKFEHRWYGATRNTTLGPIKAQRNCPTNNLIGPPEFGDFLAPLSLSEQSQINGLWEVEPVGTDCNAIKLYIPTNKGKQYLTLPQNCSLDALTWSTVPTGRSQFKLIPSVLFNQR